MLHQLAVVLGFVMILFVSDAACKRIVWTNGMEYVTVCRAVDKQCIHISRLIMGSDHLAQADWTRDGMEAPSEEQIFGLLDSAMKLGINVFDSSPIYVGGVENILGKWIKSRNQAGAVAGLNPDGRLYAISKGGFPFDLFYSELLSPGNHSVELLDTLRENNILQGAADPDGSYKLSDVPPGTYASRLFETEDEIIGRVSEELGHSLGNLPEVTIYLMHRDDNDYVAFRRIARDQTPVRVIMAALQDEKLSAGIFGFGWSNWQDERVQESLQLAQEFPVSKPLLNSPYFSLLEMNPERSIHAGGIQVTHENMGNAEFQAGLKFSPYSPLGGFSIFDQPEPQWESAQAAAKQKADSQDPYWLNVYNAIFTKENSLRFARLQSFTQQWNAKHSTAYSIDQVANAYALAHLRCDFLTVGPITLQEIQRTVESLDLSRNLTLGALDYLHHGD